MRHKWHRTTTNLRPKKPAHPFQELHRVLLDDLAIGVVGQQGYAL